MKVWDAAIGRGRAAFDWGLGASHAPAVAPDGMKAACGGADGDIVLWDLE
jgi:hypothetical protein